MSSERTKETHPGTVTLSNPDQVMVPAFNALRASMEQEAGFKLTESEWQYFKYEFYGRALQVYVAFRNARITEQKNVSAFHRPTSTLETA